jgi:hypothetical protein
MTERNYELVDYKEWLNKPNILVDSNKQTLSKLQSEAMNIMLHNVQVEIYRKRDKMDYKDFAVHDFFINSKDLKNLFNVSDGTTASYIAKEMAKLNEIALKDYRDDGSFEAMVLFPNVKYDATNFCITFRVNTKISEFMYKKEKGYTRLDLSKIRQYDLNKHAFNLLEVIYKNIFRFRLNQYVEFTTEEFKRLLGASSECSNYYFKSNVMMKALGELNKNVGIDVDFALNTSLSHNKIKSVRLYLDCSKENNLEFVKEYDKITKHKSKEDIDEIRELLKDEQNELIDEGKAYIDAITGKYVGSSMDTYIPKECTIPTESKTLGLNLLINIIMCRLEEKQNHKLIEDKKVYNKKDIKSQLLSKTYEQYCITMEKLELQPVDKYYFNLGYRHFKYKK